MNTHTLQRRAPRAINHLVSMLQSFNFLTAGVMAAPPKGRIRRVPSPDRAEAAPTGDLDDDLANATWEDAEWR